MRGKNIILFMKKGYHCYWGSIRPGQVDGSYATLFTLGGSFIRLNECPVSASFNRLVKVSDAGTGQELSSLLTPARRLT